MKRKNNSEKNKIFRRLIWILGTWMILLIIAFSVHSLTSYGSSPQEYMNLLRKESDLYKNDLTIISDEAVALSDSIKEEETSALPDSTYADDTSALLDSTYADDTSALLDSTYADDTLTKAIPTNSCIIREPAVNDEDYELALSLFDALPEHCKQTLLKNEWTILLSGSTLSERRNVDFPILGTTVYDEKRIYIDHRTKAIYYALYHEIGHALAEINGQADITSDFYAIYEEEKDTLIDVHETGDRHCASSASEFFATIVDNILTNKGDYTYSAPKGYAYVKQFLVP